MNKQQQKTYEHAIAYATAGLKILPVNTKKIPFNDGGSTNASCSIRQIKEWWEKWPTARIALATGSTNNLFVLDIDIKNGKDGSASLSQYIADNNLEELRAEVVQTTTTGGLHIIYAIPPGRTINNSQNVDGIIGVDVRGEGGYILIAPSSLNVDGTWKEYEFEAGHDERLVEIENYYPQMWMIELVLKAGKTDAISHETLSAAELEEMFTGIPMGSRDEKLNKYAWHLAGVGVDKTIAIALLYQVWLMTAESPNDKKQSWDKTLKCLERAWGSKTDKVTYTDKYGNTRKTGK